MSIAHPPVDFCISSLPVLQGDFVVALPLVPRRLLGYWDIGSRLGRNLSFYPPAESDEVTDPRVAAKPSIQCLVRPAWHPGTDRGILGIYWFLLVDAVLFRPRLWLFTISVVFDVWVFR